jgi:uncharacterized protein YqjF (DUF2071 family)
MISLDPPLRVRRPVMLHSWRHLTFIHWPYPPESVQRTLPPGLTVDQHSGRAWVGMIPFLLTIRVPGLPLPVVAEVPEINVRTYVVGPDGERGVVFLSLDVGRLITALGARITYRLPYWWAAMSFAEDADGLRFRCRRLSRPRSAAGRSAEADVQVAPGERICDSDLTPLDRFLTARWRLYSPFGRALAAAQVEHPRWELHRARLVKLKERLVTAAGLPPPVGEPHILYSPGTVARFDLPRGIKHSVPGPYGRLSLTTPSARR